MDAIERRIREVAPDWAADAFLAHRRPSARLVHDPDGMDGELGGDPLMPEGQPWPTDDGGCPLDFLAAIDLPAVHRELPEAPLPPDGTLLFFAHADLQAPGPRSSLGAMTPSTRDGWRVLHVPAGMPTSRRAKPDPPDEPAPARRRWLRRRTEPTRTFRPTRLRAVAESSHPSLGAEQVDLDLDDGLLEQLEEAVLEAQRPGPLHRVGGWTDPTQSEPTVVTALADAGLVDDRGHVQWARHGEVDWSPEAWFLLLQLDTDAAADGPGWMWGDAGVLFFHGRPDDLRAGHFDDVWLYWDCH